MKKVLLILCCSLASLLTEAQILNAGFEQQNQLNWPTNWRPVSLVIFPIDTTCVWMGEDSIFYSSTEAHTGDRSLGLGVGSYCNNPVAYEISSMRFDADTFADQRMLFTERPSNFTFFYKFFPVMNDAMQVDILLEDANSNPVATANLRWQQLMAPTGWQQAIIPLIYQSPDTPAFVTMKFSLVSDSVVHYGSHILIDDINYTAPNGVADVDYSNDLKCYPVPAKDVLYVACGSNFHHETARLTICNAAGETISDDMVQLADNTIQLQIPDLSQGLYYIRLAAGKQTFTGRFIK